MTSQEIKEQILKLKKVNRGAMAPSIAHQVESQDQTTLAMLEISLQIALGREAQAVDGVTHTSALARALGAIVKELEALRRVIDTFGMGTVHLPPSPISIAAEDFDGSVPKE